MPRRAAKSVGKSFAYAIGAILLIVSIGGCASTPSRNSLAPPPPAVGAKLAAAHKSLEATKLQVAAFYADLRAVVAKTDELRNRPYWRGFETILLKYPSLIDPGKQADITPEVKSRLSQWSREWKTPWETVLRDYFQLANRCAILEMKRVAARRMLISVQAAYMAVVMREAEAGHQRQADKIYALVNSLDKPGAELNSIRLNRLGLYDAAPQSH